MSQLAFLQNIQVVADDKPRRTGGPGVKKEWNPPAGLVIRLWKDGSVFPSQELVDKFDLEYRQRPSEAYMQDVKAGKSPKPIVGNGFDVADSNDFPVFQTGGARLLVISPTSKDAGRVNLFDSVTCDDEGMPKLSVMDQGSATFGKTFLMPFLEEVYGIVFAKPAIEARPAVEAKPAEGDQPEVKARPAVEAQAAIEGVEYVDLVLLGKNGENSDPFTLPEGKSVAFFPKIMVKGDEKGQLTTARRENPQMYVLYPKTLLEVPAEQPAQ